MGRGLSTPSPFGQMGDRPSGMNFDTGQFRDRVDQFRQSHPLPTGMPNFDAGQFRDRIDQFRQDHPFPTNAGFPGSRPPVPMPPTTLPGPPAGGEISDGGNGGAFPGQGGGVEDGFPGGGATDGAFPGMRNFPRGSTGDTTGRVGMGWGRIANRNESGPGNVLSKAFSAVGSSGGNRPRGSNQ